MIQKLSKFIACLCFLAVLLPGNGFGSDKNVLRMALLPIPDVLPIYVAMEKGYFREAQIEVEPLPVGSAVERDQLMQAERIDGMINEISGAASFNREKVQVKIVSLARAPMGEAPLFRVLAAPKSKMQSVAELAEVPIGVSVNTVIEYITTRLLEAGGVSPEAISYKSVPVLPERLQLLLAGQLQAVTLPDPLGAAAIKAGAVELVNDTTLPDISASVITFSTAALSEKKTTVKKFMAAWDKAVTDLNERPEEYRELMLKNIRVPKNIRQDFQIPPLPRKAVPTKAQWDDVMVWMVGKKLLPAPLQYDESVTAEFLAN